MAVNIVNVRALENPAQFTDILRFEIEYEAISPLEEDLTWKLVYVGSADSDRYDQTLEEAEVGPVVPGIFRFVLEANPPNPELIPPDDLVGVTVILLTCSYRGKEFIRVGYYVNNDYIDEELRENPPEQPRVDRLQRSILTDHPRVTRYAINFDEPEPVQEAQPMDEDATGPPAIGQENMAAPSGQAPATYMAMDTGAMAGHGQQPMPPQQMYQYVPVL